MPDREEGPVSEPLITDEEDKALRDLFQAPDPFPTFAEAVTRVSRGAGGNTRSIAVAILWAGERIARAVMDQREIRAVREMSEELGKAFIESVRPPPAKK